MRYLPVLLLIGLEIFALIDCIQTSRTTHGICPSSRGSF
jgi:hypothetical protein